MVQLFPIAKCYQTEVIRVISREHLLLSQYELSCDVFIAWCGRYVSRSFRLLISPVSHAVSGRIRISPKHARRVDALYKGIINSSGTKRHSGYLVSILT